MHLLQIVELLVCMRDYDFMQVKIFSVGFCLPGVSFVC